MHRSPRIAVMATLGGLLAASALACGGTSASSPQLPQGPGTTPNPAAPPAAPVIPAIGTAAQLELATWNLEWFGDPGNGPADEALQASNVRAVLAGADVDIWGLQEVVSASQFRTLVAGLPGYRGVLANDAEVQDGARYYSDFSDAEQKVGIIFKSSLASLVSARVILAERDYDFAGRPPVEFRLRVTLGTSVDTMPIIVLHAKAGSDAASYARRLSAAAALKEWLDRSYPLRAVWVIGDFNDDVDVSITTPQPTPYAAFVQDVARWRFPTKQLSDARIASTVSFPDLIDHQLVSAVAGLRVIDRSIRAWRLDSLIPSYRTTTTDHYPVVAGYMPK